MTSGPDLRPVLDIGTARRLLSEIVAERPYFVYVKPDGRGCYYWHKSDDGGPGTPGCGIGVLLHRWQPEIFTGEWLMDHERMDVHTLLEIASDEGMIIIESVACDYLWKFQSNQDTAVPWHEAFDTAERWFLENSRRRDLLRP